MPQWTCVDEVIKNESFISDHLACSRGGFLGIEGVNNPCVQGGLACARVTWLHDVAFQPQNHGDLRRF